ncbi:MAG TPA: amino acid permease [Vicinamibacterales bacterium]|jgi:APA family basic amino acid/polyamine antiporter|nr:amino acid permease [Vicinamibacterales bacterium]
MKTTVDTIANADDQLNRAIGLSGATMLVLGSVIGSGIFLTTGIMIAQLPSVTLVLAAWAVGGLLVMAGGLSYAEMGSMYPRSGGPYVFLSEAYGPVWGYLYGWACLLVILTGSVAAVAVGFAEYFSYFVPALGTGRVVTSMAMPWGTWTLSAGQVVAAASIVLITAINYVGVKSGNVTNTVLTAMKVGALLAVPLLALIYARVDPVFAPIVAPIARPLAAFGVAMIAVMWTYEGWYYVAFAAGEIKDAARVVPRALVIGTVLLTVIYLIVNLAYMWSLTVEEMSGVTRIAERAVSALVGPAGAGLVAGTVVVSTFGCNVAGVIASSRLCFAMAADRRFFPVAARVHPVYQTPHVALLLTSLWSALLTLSGGYEALFTYVTFASVLFGVLGGISIFVLRVKKRHHHRPYRAFGYPLVPALYVLGSFALVWNTLMERPVESLAGLSLVALGLPFYSYWRRS